MRGRSNVIWFGAFLFLLLASASFFLLRIHPVMREAESMTAEFQSLFARRRDLIARPEGPPSEILLEAARDATGKRERVLEIMESELSIEVPALIPAGIGRPSIYWLNFLRVRRPEILRRAREAGLEVPSGLGFPDVLPADEEVSDLLFRFYVMEELIGKAGDSGLRSISLPRFGSAGEANRLAHLGAKKISLDFSIECTLESLFRFIMSLRDASFLYIVEDMGIETFEAGRTEIVRGEERRVTDRFLRVNMNLTMYFIPGKEEAEPGAADVYAPEGEPDVGAQEFFDELPRETEERSRIPR